MIVIIDAYNVLHAIYAHPVITDKKRHEFVRRIIRYSAKKSLEIKLVFDGGAFGMPDRERMGMVEVIFTGARETADEWIIRFVEKNKGLELAIVSSDRELVSVAKAHNLLSVKAKEFKELFIDALSSMNQQSEQKVVAPGFRKLAFESNPELDQLMAESFISLPKDIDENRDEFKISQKGSKKERRRDQKLKKL